MCTFTLHFRKTELILTPVDKIIVSVNSNLRGACGKHKIWVQAGNSKMNLDLILMYLGVFQQVIMSRHGCWPFIFSAHVNFHVLF